MFDMPESPKCSLASNPSPTRTTFDEDERKPLLLPFRPRAVENQVPASPRRREKKPQAPSKRRSKDFFDACTRPKTVWRLFIEKETLRMRRLTVLRFKKRKEEYRRLVERCEDVPAREKRLVLVLKGERLSCRWKW